MRLEYSPQSRAERLIATGRVILAAFSLLTAFVDPASRAARPGLFYLLLVLYLLYAALLAVVELSRHAPLMRLRAFTHAFDLAVFSLFTVYRDDPTSPFFVYFVFSLVCGTLRWQWRGTAWTAAVALLAFMGTGVYAVYVLHDPLFELNRFVVRGAYLVVVAAMLGYMGAYEERVRGEMTRLAGWSRSGAEDVEALARGVLEHVAGVLAAPRVLLAWEAPDEPGCLLAAWAVDGLHVTREPPDVFAGLVPRPLAEASFLCPDTGVAEPRVLHTSDEGLRRWHGVPLHPDLQARFAARAVLSLTLPLESGEGRLFVLDKLDMTSDDLVLGGIVARQVGARLDLFHLSRRLQQAAAVEERIRLARDLHDGVLQSLTGVALQIEAARSAVEAAPRAARERLLEVQSILAAEQRDLRGFIQHLRPASAGAPPETASLVARLDELCGRIERQWGLAVEMKVGGLDGGVPDELGQGIYGIVHEAVVNAARHARASVVRVEVRMEGTRVRVTVADDGRGFAFRGCHDLGTLADRNLGPVSLRERVTALRGSLVLDSSDAGARLEVTLPGGRVGA